MDHATLSVTNNSRAKRCFSYKPMVVGYYSLDENLRYCSDLRQLKYLRVPESDEVQFDLDVGRNIEPQDDGYNVIDNILQWVTENAGREEWVPPDVVCMRGLLNTLLGTPYETSHDWMIHATRLGGTIYLCAKDTDGKRRELEERSDRRKQCLSWGNKFEQYMCSGEPDGVPDAAPPFTAHVGQRVVFRSHLNSHRLLFGAEIDGVNSKTKIENCAELASAEIVELKTKLEMEDNQKRSSFHRFQLLKWWGQSFLVGINHLVCGFRDDRGVVHRLQHYKVADFPKMAKSLWDPCVCISFCDRFLQFVKSLVTEEDPNTVWCFEWKPKQEDVTACKIPGPSFLPDWFISSFPVEQVQR